MASGVPHKWRRVGWRLVAKEVEAELGLGESPRLPLPPPTVPSWEGRAGDWVVSLRLRGGSR